MGGDRGRPAAPRTARARTSASTRSSRPGPILTALGELDDALGARDAPAARPRLGPRLGRSTAARSCRATRRAAWSALERRTLPGETAADVEAELERAARRAAAPPTPRSRPSSATLLVREPFEVDRGRRDRAAPCATPRPRCSARRRRSAGASYWADAAFIAAAGIPTVLFGPAGEGAHAAEEWVSLSRTEAVARTLVDGRRAVLRVSGARQPGRRPAPPCPRRAADAARASTRRSPATRRRRCARCAASPPSSASAPSRSRTSPTASGCRRSRCSARRGRSSARCASAPASHTLVAASAGNHGRAVAHVAARRGLRCRVFLPGALARRRAARRSPARAPRSSSSTATTRTRSRAPPRRAREPGVLEIADVGESGPARWVIDGYATLFAEAAEQAAYDVIARAGRRRARSPRPRRATAPRAGAPVIGVEPVAAACLTASLAAGEPTAVPTPGTTMAGLDCAEVSPAAWPSLRAGIARHGHRRRRARRRPRCASSPPPG